MPLDKEKKDKLVDALMEVPGSDDRAGRTALLDGIPHNIRAGLNRSDNAFVDLTNILNQLDGLGRLDNGTRPLVIITHNAWRLTRVPCLQTFATGIQQDYAAVRAALESAWSNGQTERQVKRLKFIKRQMYGRANFDLLRLRVLAA